MENLDYDPSILTGRAPDNLPISINYQHPARFHDYSRMIQHIYAGSFLVMHVSLLGFIQVKSQKSNYSPFDTHGFFIIISLVALPIAIMTSGIVFYSHDPLYASKRKNIPSMRYMFLKTVFFFSTMLAPFSLVPVLFIPSELNWIGYLIICSLLVFIAAYNFHGYAVLLEKKDISNFAAYQMV